MNPCSAVRDLLTAYLDEELDDPRRAPLERHLAGCPACRLEIQSLRSSDRLLRATVGARVAASSRINEAVWSRIENEDRAAKSSRKPDVRLRRRLAPVRLRQPSFPQMGAFTGGLAIALMIALAVFFHRAPQMGPMDIQIASIAGGSLWSPAESSVWMPIRVGKILHSGDRMRTDSAGQVTARWEDGSRIVLGPGGEGSVLHLFPGIELKRGKLWAQVQKRQSADAPFTVRSPQATAQVLGTEFEMNVPKSGGATNLIVFHGTVHLFNRGGSVTAREWTQTTAVGDAAPLPPQPISPLSSSSMWWLNKARP